MKEEPSGSLWSVVTLCGPHYEIVSIVLTHWRLGMDDSITDSHYLMMNYFIKMSQNFTSQSTSSFNIIFMVIRHFQFIL